MKETYKQVLRSLGIAVAIFIPIATVSAQTSHTGGRRAGIDVLHYEFHVDFPARGIPDTIAVASTITALRTARTDSLVLDLRSVMHVLETRVNGTVVSP
ncbi:MAG: hypothetical protein ABIT38_14965, partial [Gemmatimonadaceae bacterium]